MSDGVDSATRLRGAASLLRAKGAFVAWALSLPVVMGLLCVFCSGEGQSMTELPVLVCAVSGVLGGAVGSGSLASLVSDGRLSHVWLRRFVTATLAFAAAMAACVALRLASIADSASFASMALRSWRLSFAFGSFVLFDVIAAALLPLSFLLGAAWYWAGCALLKTSNEEKPPSWRPSWADCAADVLALFFGALLWPAWHDFVLVPRDDASFAQVVCGLFVPLLMTTAFSVGAWLRGTRLHPTQLGRALAMAALGACAARVFAMAVPWICAPSLGASFVALLVQAALVIAFCALAAKQRPHFMDAVAKDVEAPHLSAGLNALLALYGLTDKEGRAFVLKEKGASSARVGEMLGIKAPTVREYQRRARTKLGDEGMRQVRDELRREESAHTEEQLAQDANLAGLTGASFEFTLALAALMAFGEACSFEGHADWFAVTLSAGLVVAWLALHMLWFVGAKGFSPQVRLAMRLVETLSLIGLALWCASIMKILPHLPIPGEAGYLLAIVLVSVVSIRMFDAVAAQAGLRDYGPFGVVSCLATGFLVGGCWRAFEGGGFGVESFLLCVIVLGGMFWLFGRFGLPAIWFAVFAVFLLALVELTAGTTLCVAVFLDMAVAFALAAALLGTGKPDSRGHDAPCGIWASPRAFDVLLVAAGGSVLSVLFARLSSYYLNLDGSQISGKLGSVLLSGGVMVFVLALALLIVLGLMDVDAALRGNKLRSSMDDAALQNLEGELIKQGLTERQAKVAFLLAEGWTPEEVADRLGYSRGTVSGDRGALYKVLGVRTRSGLVTKLKELSGISS